MTKIDRRKFNGFTKKEAYTAPDSVVSLFRAGASFQSLESVTGLCDMTIKAGIVRAIGTAEVSQIINARAALRTAERKTNLPDLLLSPEKLRASREKAGFTQSQIAEKIGVHQPDIIRQWGKGERKPSANFLLRWMLICKITPRDLV